MSLSSILAVILALSLTAYAIFAGADFGAGVLDLLSRDATQRVQIARSIGPIWEANHVWLIFTITILFSAFPAAFAALGTALLAPLTLALLAVVLRGAAFGLRGSPDGGRPSDARLGRVFGAASVAAPLLFGSIAGGLAQVSSSRHAVSGAVPSVPWTGGFALVVAVLAVALCTQLAASFLTLRLVRAGQSTRAEAFRRRALQSGGAVLVASVVALIVGGAEAPAFTHRLLDTALPAVIVALLALVASLPAFAARHYRLARWATVLGAGALVWGWIIAQAPHLIGQLTIRGAAASHSALTAVAVAVGIVLISVLPAVYLLFTMFARPRSEEAQ